MSVYELNREQLNALKQAIICRRIEQPSYRDLVEAEYSVSDDEVFTEYEGISFVTDDFI